MQSNRKGKIVETKVGYDCVEVLLDNGTKVTLCSNPGYLHVHLSNIDVEKPIEVEKAANQLNIKYTPSQV